MSNRPALAIVQAALDLARTHRHAPLLDVLDLVMKGRTERALDFADPASPHGSLVAPGARFGQLLAAVFDEAMTPAEWEAFTGTTADALRCPRRLVAGSSRVRSTRDGDRTDEEAIHRGTDHWLPA